MSKEQEPITPKPTSPPKYAPPRQPEVVASPFVVRPGVVLGRSVSNLGSVTAKLLQIMPKRGQGSTTNLIIDPPVLAYVGREPINAYYEKLLADGKLSNRAESSVQRRELGSAIRTALGYTAAPPDEAEAMHVSARLKVIDDYPPTTELRRGKQQGLHLLMLGFAGDMGNLLAEEREKVRQLLGINKVAMPEPTIVIGRFPLGTIEQNASAIHSLPLPNTLLLGGLSLQSSVQDYWEHRR